MILHVAQHCECQYAWVQHVAIARGVGVGDALIATLERGEAPANSFDERESMAFILADEVLTQGRAMDDTFAVLRSLFSPREVD